MSGTAADGDRDRSLRSRTSVGLEELRRRNGSAVAIDVLYVFTTAFLATLAVRGFWPLVIASLPLATFLYFAWYSSRGFFLANVLAIALSVAATMAGLVPL